MFEIGKRVTKEEAIPFNVYYEGSLRIMPEESDDDDVIGENRPLNSQGQPAEFVTFYLAPMTGKVQRMIADSMMVMDQRTSKTSLRTGSATRARVLASVVAVEGIEYKGVAINVLTEKTYDALPGWMISAVAERLDQINGDDVRGDGDSDDEDDSSEG